MARSLRIMPLNIILGQSSSVTIIDYESAAMDAAAPVAYLGGLRMESRCTRLNRQTTCSHGYSASHLPHLIRLGNRIWATFVAAAGEKEYERPNDMADVFCCYLYSPLLMSAIRFSQMACFVHAH